MSSLIRNLQKRKAGRPRKGLGSTGEKKGPAQIGRASVPRPGGPVERRPVYRAECHRCHGTGERGRVDGRPVPCGCVPGSRLVEGRKANA